jgi:transcriptional regulator with XRE-family HTH domain
MTQLQLQIQTGIDQALISKYESGERIIPTDTLITLADFFNVSMDYVIGRTDDNSPWK